MDKTIVISNSCGQCPLASFLTGNLVLLLASAGIEPTQTRKRMIIEKELSIPFVFETLLTLNSGGVT
jgi:hypothetical protein